MAISKININRDYRLNPVKLEWIFTCSSSFCQVFLASSRYCQEEKRMYSNIHSPFPAKLKKSMCHGHDHANQVRLGARVYVSQFCACARGCASYIYTYVPTPVSRHSEDSLCRYLLEKPDRPYSLLARNHNTNLHEPLLFLPWFCLEQLPWYHSIRCHLQQSGMN